MYPLIGDNHYDHRAVSVKGKTSGSWNEDCAALDPRPLAMVRGNYADQGYPGGCRRR